MQSSLKKSISVVKLMTFSISQQLMVIQQMNGDGVINIKEKNEDQLRAKEMIKMSIEEPANLNFYKFA